MRKGKIIKELKQHFDVKKMYYPIYDFLVKGKSQTYFIKVINTSSNHQITVNSKYIWELKKGRINGIKFTTLSSQLINLKEFNTLDNKIIMLTNKPYKLLKALNESDLKDMSEVPIINDIFITYEIDKLIEYINK